MPEDQQFTCQNCHKIVSENDNIGTKNRNHCPFCLWSKHVDEESAGDRKSNCHSPMEPIGLTFKKEGVSKYGKHRQGEIMIIHQCEKDGKISLNRIAGDDDPKMILQLLPKSQNIELTQNEALLKQSIIVLDKSNETEINRQLFGDKIN